MIFGSPIQHQKGIAISHLFLVFLSLLLFCFAFGTWHSTTYPFTQLAQVFASLNVHDNDRTSTIEVGGDRGNYALCIIHQLTPYSKPFIITLNTKLFIFLFSGISLLSDKTHAAFLPFLRIFPASHLPRLLPKPLSVHWLLPSKPAFYMTSNLPFQQQCFFFHRFHWISLVLLHCRDWY